ncbi:hypothetical protein EIN_337490 [Entamoeba invadens IP1]|uniref:Uncharacterized protein n=1 Tax=Entamoeba invadens IP1 TaxID=370355 RepID=A0A0A1TXD1_ENTIV|nr:hypothetical protein EIN_337490 [Entamoeba invadens IP1]ELP84160.1 hypothetical protein EIN_337490 [Entamoeba invadens IP1]|eukprot:XP_004183506.1 hypothetical protein EIN_337490 [Entamoeba invadens IP1]
MEIPMELFHFGGSANFELEGETTALQIPQGSAEPLKFEIQKNGKKINVELYAQQVDGIEKNGFDLKKTLFVEKQYIGQSVSLPIKNEVLNEEYQVPLVVPENEMTFDLGELGMYNAETQKRGKMFLVVKTI